MAKKLPLQNRKRPKRLLLEPLPVAPSAWVIPRWWLTAIIGLFLLAPAYLLTNTFFNSFSRALQREFWATEEFWFFSLGAVLWVLWFFASLWLFGEPRPLRLYVFGHELTHAVWVWIMGGQVSEFRVGRDGGHIRTDRDNFWISLAPYFYPIYSLALIGLYGAGSFFYDLASETGGWLGLTPLRLLFLSLGLTWCFHLSFTCWMVPKGQTDLTRHGTAFSLVVIYIMNLGLLSLFLIVASPEITFGSFGGELLDRTEDFSAWVWRGLAEHRWMADSF